MVLATESFRKDSLIFTIELCFDTKLGTGNDGIAVWSTKLKKENLKILPRCYVCSPWLMIDFIELKS